MGKSSLGRVLDPRALDACPGPRARLRVEVPAAWLAEGADLLVTAPPRLSCARCDGGGCDACARSGALRAPADAGARVLRTRLPSGLATGAALVVRIPHPFGAEHEIHQLLLEVAASGAASACVVRIARPAALACAAPAPVRMPVPLFVLAVAAAIVWMLFGR